MAALHLLGSGRPPCGIGDFGRILYETARDAAGSGAALVIEPGAPDVAAIWRGIARADALIAHFPVVAWKRAIVGPVVAFALAALRGRDRIAVLHEWGGLHPLRRLVVGPVLLLSSRIALVSPTVGAELAADPLVGFLARRCAVIPVPPNLARPPRTAPSPLRARLTAARSAGRLVVGHFGSIYPGKQPAAMLDVAQALRARGADPLLVFIGSFVTARDGIEGTFRDRVAALDLADHVVVSGYVADAPELFGLFEAVDAFAYVLAEGLTARRASVLACVQAGRPVVVTAPARADEFDHHPRYRALLESGAIETVASRDPEAYADAILAVRARPTRPPDLDAAVWFADAAERLRALVRPERADAQAMRKRAR